MTHGSLRSRRSMMIWVAWIWWAFQRSYIIVSSQDSTKNNTKLVIFSIFNLLPYNITFIEFWRNIKNLLFYRSKVQTTIKEEEKIGFSFGCRSKRRHVNFYDSKKFPWLRYDGFLSTLDNSKETLLTETEWFRKILETSHFCTRYSPFTWRKELWIDAAASISRNGNSP